MTSHDLQFNRMIGMLGRLSDDDLVKQTFGTQGFEIERIEYYGFLTFKMLGVDVVFNEMAFLPPDANKSQKSKLRVCAFHLHRQGHDGYCGFSGKMPLDLAFNDLEADVVRKLGSPRSQGGGNRSTVMGRTVPYWVEYSNPNYSLHLQFDQLGRLELVTLGLPKE